eukprot:EC820581.1.p1 GENE.EC820581.1~~EC820581.1.p1  ORF type:complete len:125 (+),score=62.22 EC820581.1:61-435(+)
MSIQIPQKTNTTDTFGTTPGGTVYGQTPGGTVYGTTPGGTKIIYDRNFIKFLKNSPMSKTPPVKMPFIQGVTKIEPKKDFTENKDFKKENIIIESNINKNNNNIKVDEKKKKKEDDDEMFKMDI